MKPSLFLVVPLLLAATLPSSQEGGVSRFSLSIGAAERALDSGDHAGARELIQRALERDRRSARAWDLRARWAEVTKNEDELIYSLHQANRLARAQGAPQAELDARLARLLEVDPVAPDLFGLKKLFIEKLTGIALKYEEEQRPHSAISVHKQVLAIDPENVASADAIVRIASKPDPSLAGNAKPRDLFEGVSKEWIREHDAKHSEWKDRSKLEREHYITITDAGYEVMVRAAEAMEQMNAFYREFFQYGIEGDSHAVPRIELRIFKTRDEYLKHGSSPAEWSGGQFTGGAVETYVSGADGFNGMVGTLFHEAAHQFVSLATTASGWLNEGLASFFEGTQLLGNGAVVMNMPANGRLMPLARRMDEGWMANEDDGIDAKDTSVTPRRSPTFRIVLENRYEWGPAWYAPTWGVVYFLYNYQDPRDGRYVYRAAFRQFVNKSGGRVGEGAVGNFEEVVLGNPAPPIEGVVPAEGSEEAPDVRLPKNIEELNAVWKEWILRLRDEQLGRIEVARPYKTWGRYAIIDENWAIAKEHFEQGLVANPEDPELLLEFAGLLAERFKNSDRAAKLVLQAIQELERAETPDTRAIKAAEKRLAQLDPTHESLEQVTAEMEATAQAIVQRYMAAQRPSMVMDVAWRLGTDFKFDSLFESYETALRQVGSSQAIWELAYNEENLDGWNLQGTEPVFEAAGMFVESSFETYSEERFDYRFLTLDEVTSGDFSMDAEVSAKKGSVNYCGFVFGNKDSTTFHGLLFFPGKTQKEGTTETGYVDLMSSYGDNVKETWRHVPVDTRTEKGQKGQSASEVWHNLRVDVSGKLVDVWFDGELLATHEFPSVDVLRGKFGLLTGVGDARYRNVRYLARDPRDPAAKIERDVRMESVRSEGGVGGSYLGFVPPFPDVQKWVQGERTDWAEKGHVPQLLVFFSTEQNELVGIDQWLVDLAKRMDKVGLEIVCIASPNDLEGLEAYLAQHPLPGVVGVDSREGVGIGETFERFAIARYSLPRILLLDLDQTVAWEGDPGIHMGVAWKKGEDTFLDSPLNDLIKKRQIREFMGWKKRWDAIAVPALHSGELSEALEVLKDAPQVEARFAPEAGLAKSHLDAVRTSITALEATGASFAERGAEPALDVLLEWAPLLEVEVSKKRKKDLKPVLDSKSSKDWTSALRFCKRHLNKKKGTFEEKRAELLQNLEGLTGSFAEQLRADLTEAAEDQVRFDELCESAESRPLLWLAREYFA